MKIQHCGAAGMVTGSCHLLDTGEARILVDCGMFQGREAHRNEDRFPFDPASIDALVLTHAHADHIGRAPRLVREGFTGPIACTRVTAELAVVALADAAGHDDADHSAADVEALWSRISHQLRYHERVELVPGVTLELLPAGHIFGSASAVIEAGGKRIGFSGDIGRPDRPLIVDPEPPTGCDAIVIESTYGDRAHASDVATTDELLEMIEVADRDKGNIIIPAFALGRSQEVLFHLNEVAEAGLIDRFRVYLDSPLAARFREIFNRNRDLFDEDARALIAGGDDPLAFEQLRVTYSGRASREIDDIRDGAIIVASGGMCEGGRIVRHLAYNLPRANADVVLVGYQAHGSRGRAIADGAKTVDIDGEAVPVRCHVHTLSGFSGHADRAELLAWAKIAAKPGAKALVVHGEPRAANALADGLRQQGLDADVPSYRQTITL